LAEAREALQGLIGQAGDWTELDGYLIAYAVEPAMQPTVRASAFSAMLEMVREGVVDFRQSSHFAPIYLRRRRDGRLAAE
jgi:segregation and condensation protein A